MEDYNNISHDQCLESVIEDFVTYYQNNENDKFQFPFQDMHPINFQAVNDFHLDTNSGDFNPTSDLISLENITDSTTSSIDEKAVNKTEQFNGSTESQPHFNNCDGSTGSTRNLNGTLVCDFERAFDEEILFVCAEEVINSCEQFGESGRLDDEAVPAQTQCSVSDVTEGNTEDAKEISRNEEPAHAKGRIYVVSNLMKAATDVDGTMKKSSEIIAENRDENQMVEVFESNDEEEVECVENGSAQVVLDTTKKLTKRKKAIGRPKGGRNNRYSREYSCLSW